MAEACYCDYDDAPSVYDVKSRKAKKEHKCSECGGAIQSGEVYAHAWGVWDGDARAFKTCPDCLELQRWALVHVKCICWSHGDMHSIIVETFQDWEHESPGITEEAKAKIADIRKRRREIASAIRARG